MTDASSIIDFTFVFCQTTSVIGLGKTLWPARSKGYWFSPCTNELWCRIAINAFRNIIPRRTSKIKDREAYLQSRWMDFMAHDSAQQHHEQSRLEKTSFPAEPPERHLIFHREKMPFSWNRAAGNNPYVRVKWRNIFIPQNKLKWWVKG